MIHAKRAGIAAVLLTAILVALVAGRADTATAGVPTVACIETTNPAGKNVPPAGSTTLPGAKGGQNEDGFYQLFARRASGPLTDVYLRDLGSGTVWGPFPSGTKIKYTQAPGAEPSIKKMGGPNSAVQWHVKGQGDLEAFAYSGLRIHMASVRCNVPPPPK